MADLSRENLEHRRGNYILTIGFPSAGKTVLQSWLTRYITSVGPFTSELQNVIPDQASPDYDVNRTVNEWMEQWAEGRFPRATPVGDNEIREINMRVTPFQGVKTPLEFGFLEVSGEMIQSVIPGENENPTLSNVLRGFLANEQLNLILIFLIDPSSADNDILFSNFMNFLEVNLTYDIKERASLALVVSKPSVALDVLKERKPEYSALAELRGEALEDYIELAVPTTYRSYFDWPVKRKVISRFFVGDMVHDAKGARIAHPDYLSAENLFAWIYHQFTGLKLGPRLWRRIWKWIRE